MTACAQACRKLLALCLLACVFAGAALADTVDTYQFHSPEVEQRAIVLARKLRCPQCQNQNLVESNSPIARDLRLEVYRLMDAGHSEKEVIAHMTDRFGDFVLYDPPLNASTILLWVAPAALALLAVFLLWRRARAAPTTSRPAGDASALRDTAMDARSLTQQAILDEQTSYAAHLYPDAPSLAQELLSESRALLAHDTPVASPAAATSATTPARKHAFALLTGCCFILTCIIYAASGRAQAVWQWIQHPASYTELEGLDLQNAMQRSLQERIHTHPRDPDAWSELAQLYLYSDQFAQAFAAYERVMEIEGHPTAAVLAAQATVRYYQAGENLTPAAQQLLDAALALDSGEVTALMLLANGKFRQGQYDEAIAIWQRLLDEGRPRLNREAVIRALMLAKQLRGDGQAPD